MSNIYDRIFKEDIEPVIEVFAKHFLKVEMVKTEEIKDKIQITLEREGDFLKKLVFDDPDKNCILHIEFHVKDEDLTKWMLLTYGMMYHEFGLPIKQFVIYVGRKKRPKMPFKTDHENCSHEFKVINLREFSYKMFLESNIPELVVLTVLSDFEHEAATEMIHKILTRLYELQGREASLNKYVKQLEVLSRLRNLQPITVKTIEAMPFIFDLESDVRYMQGIEKGIEKNKNETVKKLLATKKFTDEQIVDLLGVAISLVKKVKKEMDMEAKGLNGKSKSN